MDIPHELRDEFPQEISLIERMIRTNYEYRRLAERYDEVNRNIYRIESGEEPTTDEVLARLKKWRLKFKDEIAAILTKLEHRMEDPGKSVRPFKGIFWDDISEFESSHRSHAVRSPPAQKWHCTARSPRSGPPSAASSICRETTTLLRSRLILAAMLVASLTSASIAACAKHSEHEKSYTRAPMRARSIAPRIEFGAAGASRRAAQTCPTLL